MLSEIWAESSSNIKASIASFALACLYNRATWVSHTGLHMTAHDHSLQLHVMTLALVWTKTDDLMHRHCVNAN